MSEAPPLSERLVWQEAAVPWYDGRLRTIEWCSGTALWYHTGKPPLALR